jgi:histidine ammonia-lyase
MGSVPREDREGAGSRRSVWLPLRDTSPTALLELIAKKRPLALPQSVIAGLREARREFDLNWGHIYGVTTAMGALARIRTADPGRTQTEYVNNYAVGHGAALPDQVVRLATVLRAHVLARGMSGVRPEVLHQLIRIYNAGYLAVVPSMGSVGASGDLIPLAHMALPLLGRGRLRSPTGSVVTGANAVRRLGLKPTRLQAKEGAALINGHSVSAATGALAAAVGARLCSAADIAAGLSVAVLGGHPDAFSDGFDDAGWGQGAADSALAIRRLISDTGHLGEFNRFGPHDPYSLRCAPQVHGAVRDVMGDVSRHMEHACRVASDNPLVLGDRGALSGGMFHGQAIALQMDNLAVALASLAGISERRVALLLDDGQNGGRLPRGLIATGETASRYVPLHILAGSYLALARHRAGPSSPHSTPLEAGLQDFVSLSLHAALKAASIAGCTAMVLAVEILTALQASKLTDRPLGAAARIAIRPLLRGAPRGLGPRVAFVAQRLVHPVDWSTLEGSW